MKKIIIPCLFLFSLISVGCEAQVKPNDIPLKEDSKNPQIDKIMDIDKEDANQLNVRGTPTIFVNEKRLSVLSQKDLFDLVESEIYK